MWGSLGEIVFQTTETPDELVKTIENRFSETSVITGKPRLQYGGRGLDEISLKISYHAAWCVPATEVKKLEAMADENAYLLVIGGQPVGEFVVIRLKQTLKRTTSDGKILSILVELNLKEMN